MKKLIAASLAVLLMGLPGAAMAQHMDINQLIAGIGGSDFLTAAERVDAAATVRVVRLSTLAGAYQAAGRLADAEYVKERDINYLRSNLYQNPMGRSALRNAGVSLFQIVSVMLPSDNAAIVFANDLY